MLASALKNDFRVQVLSALRRGCSHSNMLALLHCFRRKGLTRIDAYAILEGLREESGKLEEQVLELMDVVDGYCAPAQRVWTESGA